MTSASDNDIWYYAANNKYILISKDEDFFHFCKKNPGVVQFIWVRIGNCRTTRLIAAFDKVWSTLDSAQTEQLNENVLLELDKDGRVVVLTIEHIKKDEGKLDFSYEIVAA